MTFSGIGKRILDAVKRWGRRDRPAPVAAHPPHQAAAMEPQLAHRASVAPLAVEAPRIESSGDKKFSRTALSVEAAAAFAASVRHLPLFSVTGMQIIRSIDQDDVTGTRLAQLISTDAALVAHLLRIVNSPYYGLAHRLGTITDAISVLGINQVRRTVTAAVLKRPLMTYLHETKAVYAFWRHELMCAALARHLALQKGVDGEVAYMTGLMHDVGRLAMLMQYPQHTDVLLRVQGDDDNFGIDRELAQFGFDHAQAGGALLELWGLPEAIVKAVHQHADDTEPHDAMSASVWRANRAAHETTAQPDDEDVQQPWMIAIGLSVEERRQILDEIGALESDQGGGTDDMKVMT